MAQWRHKRDTSQVTKVYFIEFHVKITEVNAEDKTWTRICESVKDFLPEHIANRIV